MIAAAQSGGRRNDDDVRRNDGNMNNPHNRSAATLPELPGRKRRGSAASMNDAELMQVKAAQANREQQQRDIMDAAFERLLDVSESVWQDFAPAELLADDLDRFESPSPTFGRAEEPSQPQSGYDSSPGEDSGGDFGATRTPEIYIHQSVIDADDREGDDVENSGQSTYGNNGRSRSRDGRNSRGTSPDVGPGHRRGTPTGGSGRATPEESSISVPEVAGVGGETAGAGGDLPDDDDEDEDFTAPDPICGGRWRDKAHLKEWMKDLLEEPTTSTAAKVVSFVVLICIIVSTINIVLESLPSFDPNRDGGDVETYTLFALESFCILVFSIEYLLRLWAVPDNESKLEWVQSPMNVIDLVAILPYFIDLVMLLAGAGQGGELSLLRLFRLVRIFRIFKLSRYSSNVQMCASAMIESRETLGLMIFMLLIAVTLFSAFEYFFEAGTEDETTGKFMITAYGVEVESPYTSIPATMWWCVVTLMTVGYGDMYPVTSAGKCMAIVCMICAILILALPISVIGANFSQAWLASKESKEKMSEGRELSRELQTVLSSMGEYSDLLEDLLSDACRGVEDLQESMSKARRLFDQQHGAPGGTIVEPATLAPVEPEGKLLGQVKTILRQHNELDNILLKTEHLFNSGIEEKVDLALDNFKEMEKLVSQCSNLGESIKSIEHKALSQSVHVIPNRAIDQKSVALYR